MVPLPGFFACPNRLISSRSLGSAQARSYGRSPRFQAVMECFYVLEDSNMPGKNLISPFFLFVVCLLVGTFSPAAQSAETVIGGVPYVMQRSHLD